MTLTPKSLQNLNTINSQSTLGNLSQHQLSNTQTGAIPHSHSSIFHKLLSSLHTMDGDQSAKSMEQGANSAMKDDSLASGIHETTKQTVLSPTPLPSSSLLPPFPFLQSPSSPSPPHSPPFFPSHPRTNTTPARRRRQNNRHRHLHILKRRRRRLDVQRGRSDWRHGAKGWRTA